MGREITKRMEEVYELRTLNRMSFTQIGRALGITRQAAHESYHLAQQYIQRYEKELELPQGTPKDHLDRTAEIEFLDGMMRRYLSYADAAEQKSPRNAAEILNGMHRYYDTLIKIKGMHAPIQVEHRVITNEDLEAELLKVTADIAELENYVDAEVIDEQD